MVLLVLVGLVLYFSWFGVVGRGYVMNVGRDYVMNVGRGYVIQNSQSVSQSGSNEGRYRAARAAKKRVTCLMASICLESL